MSDLIEHMASAIMAADGPAASYQDLARAALKALRAVVAEECRAAIDEALKP
jgi:hypothetical protein